MRLFIFIFLLEINGVVGGESNICQLKFFFRDRLLNFEV